MTAQMPIRVPRNAQYKVGWTFLDRKTREPLDISDWTFALDVKYSAGFGSPIASATFDNIDAPAGSVDVTINGADFATVRGAQETVRLAYDCLVQDSDGVVVAMVEGVVLLTPGVSTL